MRDGEVTAQMDHVAVVAGDFNDGRVRMEATSRGSHDGDGPLHASPRGDAVLFFANLKVERRRLIGRKKILDQV